MAQNILNDVHRCVVMHQIACQGMTQGVGAMFPFRNIDADFFKIFGYENMDAGIAKRRISVLDSNEDICARACRTRVLDVVYKRVAHVLRQRKLQEGLSLVLYEFDRAVLPIQVRHLQPTDVTGSHPQF